MTVTLAGESTIFFSFPLAMETLLSKRTFCVDFDELESAESVFSCGEVFTLSLSAKKIICPPLIALYLICDGSGMSHTKC